MSVRTYGAPAVTMPSRNIAAQMSGAVIAMPSIARRPGSRLTCSHTTRKIETIIP